VERKELIRKLEAMLDDAAREKSWGTIELQISDGEVTLIRTSKTEKVSQESIRGHQKSYNR
jgi:hypothetical protein